jgi:hypothetical protein
MKSFQLLSLSDGQVQMSPGSIVFNDPLDVGKIIQVTGSTAITKPKPGDLFWLYFGIRQVNGETLVTCALKHGDPKLKGWSNYPEVVEMERVGASLAEPPIPIQTGYNLPLAEITKLTDPRAGTISGEIKIVQLYHGGSLMLIPAVFGGDLIFYPVQHGGKKP